MSTRVDLPALLKGILSRDKTRRTMVAIAGPPGAGKSTFAERLKAAIVERGTAAELVPMDGFHLDDAILDARGTRPRKGAPHTFDVAGLHATLTRLREDAEPEVFVPVFDRLHELSRAGARAVTHDHRVVIAEGLYLLLDRPGWRTLRDLFDVTVMLNVDPAELRRRLERRWVELGLSPDAVRRKLDENDLDNGETVIRESAPSDYVVVNQDRDP